MSFDERICFGKRVEIVYDGREGREKSRESIYLSLQERNPDWPSDVDGRITYGINVGKDRGFIRKGDNLVVITGWRQGTGYTNTMRIIQAE